MVQGTIGLDANGQKNHAGCLSKPNCQLQSAVCLLFLFSASVQSSSGPSSPDNNNYLRVQAAFGSRRLSENVLNSTGNRRGIIGSSHSSPGSTPGSPNAFGLPIRRHSSAAFAANRRYSSNALLSPSTAAQVPMFHVKYLPLGDFTHCDGKKSGGKTVGILQIIDNLKVRLIHYFNTTFVKVSFS